MSGLVSASLKGGYEQAGGAYYIILNDLADGETYAWDIPPGSGSGATYVPGTPEAHSFAAVELVASGKLIKDMGKTVLIDGITFRKFQVVKPAVPNGVTGTGAAATTSGYETFYLVLGRSGLETNEFPHAPIARYC